MCVDIWPKQTVCILVKYFCQQESQFVNITILPDSEGNRQS